MMPSPPVPPQLRAIRGNVGHQRKSEPANGPQAKVPPCPRELGPHERRLWRTIGASLLKAGLIADVDGPAFAALVVSYSRWLRITESLKDAPIWVERLTGAIEPNPAIRLQAEAQRDYLRALEAFGAAPAWRAKATPVAPPKVDDLTDWLTRKA